MTILCREIYFYQKRGSETRGREGSRYKEESHIYLERF